MNPCNECTACCEGFLTGTIPILNNFELKEGQPCPAVSQKGCTIYDQRPKICSDYICKYKQHLSWPVEWRPDKSGIITWVSTKKEVKRLMVRITRQDYNTELYGYLQKLARQENNKFVVIYPISFSS